MNLPLDGNYIDLIILAVFGLYIIQGLERGFWTLTGELVSFLISLIVGLRAYSFVAQLLVLNFSLPGSYAKGLGFVIAVMVSGFIMGMFLGRLFDLLPRRFWDNWYSRLLSVFPAIANAGVLVAAFLTLLVSIPISPTVKNDIVTSKIGGWFVGRTGFLEKTLSGVFGGALSDTLTFLTIKTEGNERIDLNFKPTALRVDEASEKSMLDLINKERKVRGVEFLKIDAQITAVARSHSADMWNQGYFAHISPEGKAPFDRMREGGVRLLTAGENLALAPTIDLAHEGLMNSEGHKRNILDPDFKRVGIGIIDGGIYGKMITQNFAD